MSNEFLALAAGMFAPPPAPKWETPGDLASLVSPHTVQTTAMDLIDEALVELYNTPNGRLIISLPPQEGKAHGPLRFSRSGYSANGPTPASCSPLIRSCWRAATPVQSATT